MLNQAGAAPQQTDEAVFSSFETAASSQTTRLSSRSVARSTPAPAPSPRSFPIKSAPTCQERPDGVLRYLTQWQ